MAEEGGRADLSIFHIPLLHIVEYTKPRIIQVACYSQCPVANQVDAPGSVFFH